MKKRFIILLATMLASVISLTACGAPETTTVSSEKMQAVAGSYFLYKTVDAQEYLSFLEDLDETKFEIVDISTSMMVGGYGSDEFYMVTYKVIETE